MRFIGITGGVGAGKSAILSFIQETYHARIMLADEVAHELMKPGSDCYEKLKLLFREDDVYQEDGTIDARKMAAVIFTNEEKRLGLNGIVHPAVKAYVVDNARMEQERGAYDYLILEAALLIEEHYDTICDELWYIYTKEENRRRRLKESRGYSDEKITQIFSSQLSEECYRSHCKTVIDNNGTVEATFQQITAIFNKMRDTE